MPAAAARVAVGAYWDGLTLGRVVSGAIAHRVAPARVLSSGGSLADVHFLSSSSSKEAGGLQAGSLPHLQGEPKHRRIWRRSAPGVYAYA